jgi:pentose-5-phosphate-3-epimerase
MLEETLGNMREAKAASGEKKKPAILADKNYFSEENLKACREAGAEAVIAGRQYKKRFGKSGMELICGRL